jgi:c-di-GMP-binding flagellar brake protein YcgR
MTPGVQRFFEQVADAYRASPIEILGVVLFLLLLLGGLITYAVVWSRREQRHKTELANELYEQKSRELGLTPSQRELLSRMAHYLKDPASIHLLVTDEVAFNAAATQLRENEEATPQSIAALRVTLGYQNRRAGKAPHSSTQLPEGATVLIARSRYKKPIKAKVMQPQPHSLIVHIVEEGARLPAGAAVDVYFQNTAGVFTFRSTVLGEDGTTAKLSHSEEIKQYQKRRYYRRRIELPVHIYPFDEEKPVLSRFRDIGGGGASIINPDRRFHEGDELELRFTPDDVELRLTGTVMRVSEGGNIIHVNYEHIRDALRDKIYAAIFRPPKDEQDEMERRTTEQKPGGTPAPPKE